MVALINKILKKYRALPAPVLASIWFTICSFLQKGIAFITVPIFTRLLTQEQFGVFSVYNSWYSIISTIATLNLSAGVYNNCMTKYPKKRNEVTAAFQGLSTTATAILFVVYLINMDFWNNLLNLSSLFVVLMFMEILFMPAYSFWTVAQRYDYKYIGIVILTLVIALGSPILGIIAVLSTEYKAEARIISHIFVQVVVGLLFYIYNFAKGKKFFSKEFWLFALRFNLPLIPHYLSMTLLNQADRVMISNMVSPSAAAVYTVAYSVSSIMNIITSAINSSFIPYSYRALKDENYHGICKNTNFLLLLVGSASLLTMAFGPEVVLFVGGREYYDAIWIIPPVAASVFFTFLYPLFANVEFYYEKTIGVMIASCCGAVANIVLNYIFILIFGYYAAGYTTLVCYIVFVVAHYCFYRSIIKKKIDKSFQLYDMKVIIGLSILEIITMVGMTLTYRFTVLRYSIICLLIGILLIKRKRIVEQFKKIKSR